MTPVVFYFARSITSEKIDIFDPTTNGEAALNSDHITVKALLISVFSTYTGLLFSSIVMLHDKRFSELTEGVQKVASIGNKMAII